jgi:hypothetical protein
MDFFSLRERISGRCFRTMMRRKFTKPMKKRIVHSVVCTHLLAWLSCLPTHAAGPPIVATLSAAQNSLTSASANGAVDPNGFDATVFFQYGLTTNYGSVSAAASYPANATALYFNGINQNGLVAGFGNIAPTTEITIEFWENATALGNNAPCFLNPEYPTNRIAVSVPWGDGGTYWDFGDITSGGRLVYYPTNPLTEVWQHYAVVASQSGNYMRIYRDGILQAQTTGMKPFAQYNADLLLGGGTIYDYYFYGGLCEFRIWNAALDQTTIQKWMSSSLNPSHPYYSNLAGYWPMSDGTGATAADDSGNGQNATLQNGPTWIQGPSLTNYQVNLPLTGLLGHTVYHYRLVASNSAGVTAGPDMTFQTVPFSLLPVTLPGVSFGSASWADFENEGKLDILFTGSSGALFPGVPSLSQLWHNLGNGAFSNLNLTLPSVEGGSIAVGDFDNDGLLDFVIAGTTNVENGSAIAQVWRNLGNGTFAKIADLPGLFGAAVAVGDLYNDGHLDIVLAGENPNKTPMAQIWRNFGNGTFSNTASLTGVGFGSVTVADFDNDGYQDILLTGLDRGLPTTQLWRNLGNGVFTNVIINLPGVENSAVGVGDFDNDGSLDILLSGFSTNGDYISQLWHNLGNDQFTNLNVALPPVLNGALPVGDFNNDGRPDFLVSGTLPSGNSITQLFENQGDGAFTNVTAFLPAVQFSGAAWGDSQNDGRLDLLLTGSEQPLGDEPITEIIKNDCAVTNTPPTAPTGLSSVASLTSVALSWHAATDAQTPSAGLTYNVRVGTVQGGFDVVCPQADVATGWRRLPALGNAGERLFSFFNLPPGTYYWSVQAVDSAFAGSPFASEAQFAVGAPVVTTGTASSIQFTSAVLNGTLIANGAAAAAWFQWGATTNYGSLTTSQELSQGTNLLTLALLASPLQPGTTYNYRLVATNSFGASFGANQTFTTPVNPPPPMFTGASIQNGGQLLLKMQGGSGVSYTLLASTNLQQWVAVTNLTAALDGQLLFLDTTTHQPTRFFRLRFP